jgi:hypothetical protein
LEEIKRSIFRAWGAWGRKFKSSHPDRLKAL